MQDNAGHNKEKRQKVRRMQDNAGEKTKIRTLQDMQDVVVTMSK